LGIASKDIGWIFGQATIVTLVAVLFGSWLNIRIGRAIPLMAGAAAVLFSVIAISLHQRGLFSLIVVSFLSGWMFSFPYYFGLVGQADPIGRASAFGMSVQFLGLAVGPPIGAMLMGEGAGFGNAELAAALFVVACVLGIAGDRSLRRATAEAPNYLVTQ
jgi:MFS family permease